MATIEEVGLAIDAVNNLRGLRRDMRRNAESYVRSLDTESATLERVIDVTQRDADEYLRRLRWVERFNETEENEGLRRLHAGLVALGVDPDDMERDLLALHKVAQVQSTQKKESDEDIRALSTLVLDSVPEHYRVWA